MRIAVIDYDLCDPQKCGGFLCQRVCPVNMQGKECIARRDVLVHGSLKERPVINEELCIGCGICVKKCPLGAIKIVNTPEQLKEDPVHRHGVNGFVLFRLPIPRKGVVGILGENGLGKSTALKILAGQLKPNLGKEDASWDEIIRIHRGNEIQTYLEKLSKGEIKAVYKPQQVEVVKKVYGDKEVSELLGRIKPGLVEEFGLSKLSGRKVSDLSGGELQKLMICLAMSAEGTTYLIDEPSSYLDVVQRMKVASLLRSDPEKYVVVIEHDLATLDLMSDYVHIFYGHPGAFGIVSKPYSPRNGINAFLEGYIKEDNVRFHDGIKFISSVVRNETGKLLASVPAGTAERGSFRLEYGEIELHESEIVGMVGANGLGKSTLMSEIAEKLGIGVAYKKQFIEPVDGLVRGFIGRTDQAFMLNVVKPLGLERLMEKEVKNLSGGELQRAWIAATLAQEADAYLLDEPCAFLDVKQRLALAKVLRNFGKPMMVIDHDMMFISYVSDSLVVFTGEPAVHGRAEQMPVKDGMNAFLKGIGVTFRKDPQTGRPRPNKPGSQKDVEQRSSGVFYEA